MGAAGTSFPAVEWPLLEKAPELREWYLREGYWTDATLTDLVVDGLARNRDKEFRVWSQTRPTRHLLADVEARARRARGGARGPRRAPG